MGVFAVVGNFVHLGAGIEQMLYSMFMQLVAPCMHACDSKCTMLTTSSHSSAWQLEGSALPNAAFHWVLFWELSLTLHVMESTSLCSFS